MQKPQEESARKIKIALLPFEMRGNVYQFDAPLQAAKAQKAQDAENRRTAVSDSMSRDST